MKISIIYYSQTGNTEQMANLINQGALSNNHEVTMLSVSDASLEDIMNSDIVVLGCPSMGVEVLEEYEFEPFYQSIAPNLAGKRVELFGSYDWGDGEWMRNWQEDVLNNNAYINLEPLILVGFPFNDDEQRCIDFGASL